MGGRGYIFDVSPREAAELCGATEQQVREWIRQGHVSCKKLPPLYKGQPWSEHIPVAELDVIRKLKEGQPPKEARAFVDRNAS
jgi:DNA-binding transcriptional MerR regulator